jgi:hypothetical protein
LTLPEAEAAHVAEAYDAADVILEYGSGGSTVMASELPGKTVFSVESDQAWLRMMHGWLAQNRPAQGTRVEIIWSNVGETGDWGRPVNDAGWRHYADYPLAIWQREDFVQPDVVLVDGRFRPGCAMATAFCTARPVTVLVDDYKRRKSYHAIEEFLGAPRLIGRMAEFEVAPMAVPAHRLLPILKMMTRP